MKRQVLLLLGNQTLLLEIRLWTRSRDLYQSLAQLLGCLEKSLWIRLYPSLAQLLWCLENSLRPRSRDLYQSLAQLL